MRHLPFNRWRSVYRWWR